ncbi:MAG: glutathione synthase [Alphaproteobacteria bacterium PA2]|nr:MAG: glutathione synthase [Alphaproteobacteria bacterium PA2]
MKITGRTDADLGVAPVFGLAVFAQMIFNQQDLNPVWNILVEAASNDPPDPGALLNMSMLLQLTGQPEPGLDLQTQALAMTRMFKRTHGDGSGLRILAIVTPGDFMANTPLDFLLSGSDATAYFVYATPDGELPEEVPDHDVAFFAIGESTANYQTLLGVAPALAGWRRPIINGSALTIAGLTRDGVCEMCAGIPEVLAPSTAQVFREGVQAIAEGLAPLSDFLEPGTFPIIIRPIDSHAGRDLEKMNEPADLKAYLAAKSGENFYITQFIDYSGPDGLFRKQRVAFLKGKPFISHMAVSEHWMVHYLNASMDEKPERRDEEAAFMDGFDQGFALRHSKAFEGLYRAFGLEYFAIDCAELPDGRLLLFEADVAMIIHALDSPELYPYKPRAMAKLFSGVMGMLDETARAA